MTTAQPNILAQVEAHIAAYLGSIEEITYPIFIGQTSDDYSLPCIVVATTGSKEIATDADTNWEEVSLRIGVMTSLFVDIADSDDGSAEDPDAAQNHADQVGLVKSYLLDYELGSDIEEAPAAIFGFDYESAEETQTDKMFSGVLDFKASAAPYYAG